MAKSAILLVAPLCLVSFVGSAYGLDKFYVRAKFTVTLAASSSSPGPASSCQVRLECKDYGADNVTFSKEAITDETGSYRIEVDGDHQDELCEVVLVESSRADCTEVDRKSHIEQAAKVSLITKNGIVSAMREANPLGFLLNEPLPICSLIFHELGLRSDGLPLN